MPFWLGKAGASPARKPPLVGTVAPVRLALLSLAVMPPSSVTDGPPPTKVGSAPPANTGGDDMLTVLVACALASTPSLTVQVRVRCVSSPELDGLAFVELNAMLSSTCW